ncbi:glycosyltransferase family protein [Mucilaginibacter sp. FT3.2]|uniref:glycosyltransferase family protein n=1 Tax=Mucilaginibacter sp. FT3.2 TaxID=2723090 RepID=UPI00160A2E1B|nr:hypothetical protein [Mucilaginibacter sp. FT3.2]MBB6231312.1 glycosyltransferase involved in cell wall biosynthesis [Mucilaginibacter sp. FT3.2]
MTKKICIITQSHLCHNPRVVKEAIALESAGYKVAIITGIISADLYQLDLEAIKNAPNICIEKVFDISVSSVHSFADRLLTKLGRLLIRTLKFETGQALGYGTTRYYKMALATKADLYICHQEFATYLGTKLLRKGLKVSFDFEDWYSEDLLPEARTERPINLLRKAESTALNKGTFCITTSNAMAAKLVAVYSSKQPDVIYNVFPSEDVISKSHKVFTNPIKLFWFSQTIGPGRGLEQFIEMLKAIKTGLELHLLGNVSENYSEALISLLSGQHKLHFHQLIEPNKLAAKIAQFDIGLALELDTPMSRNYTITNKFFQYVQSGLPVITSETAGQNEAFEQFKPGFKLSQQPTAAQITALENWLNNTDELQAARNRAIEAAAFYNWENESKKLLALVKTAIEK